MQITNSKTAYGWANIALHWIAAIGVIVLYLYGDKSAEAPTRELKLALRAEHVSIGVLLFVFLAARVVWSLTQPKPEKLAKGKWVGLLAKTVQYLFIAMIAVQIVTGPLLIWSTAHSLKVFDWFEIPTPFSAPNRGLHEILETTHKWSAKLLWPLLILHALGALKSLFIDRDRTLQRMLWVRRAPGV